MGKHHVSRVNLMAAIVTKEGNTIIIDDGTGSIDLKIFENPEKTDGISIGDIILIIGRPREYAGKRYVAPEIIRKITDKKWIEHRRKELEKEPIENIELPSKKNPPKQNHEENNEEETSEYIPERLEEPDEEPKTNYAAIIIKTIKELDSGSGADIDKVIKMSKLDDAEKYIETLLNEGEIFELRAGKIKVLE
jgi:hypothetical protein